MTAQIIDYYADTPYNMAALVEMVNNLEYVPSQLSADGVYDEIPVPYWDIAFDILEEQISRLATGYPNGQPNMPVLAKAALKKLSTYHLKDLHTFTPQDALGFRDPGGVQNTSKLSLIARAQMNMVKRIELTLEWFRMSAIQGAIKEPGDNTKTLASATTLLDLESEFSKSVQTLDFVTETATTDIRGKCVQALRLMETAFGGRSPVSAIGYCDSAGFDALVGHATVTDAFKYTQSLQPSTDLRNGFNFGGILWKEYRQRQISGVNEFIAANTAYIVPVGMGNFRSFYGPALYFSQINTEGSKYFSKMVDSLDDSYTQLQVQSNPLIINTNPDAVIKATLSTPA